MVNLPIPRVKHLSLSCEWGTLLMLQQNIVNLKPMLIRIKPFTPISQPFGINQSGNLLVESMVQANQIRSGQPKGSTCNRIKNSLKPFIGQLEQRYVTKMCGSLSSKLDGEMFPLLLRVQPKQQHKTVTSSTIFKNL